MALPTVNDVQAVDPVLTNMLIGYQQDDSRFVATRAFPGVMVDKDSGTYYTFTKKYWFFDDLQARAPGGDFKAIDVGVSTSTYATRQFAGEFSVPWEVAANSQVPMDLETANLRKAAQASLIRKEVAFGADFMTTSVWGTDDNNSTTDWDDYASGDPVADFLTAKRTISQETGYTANTLVMGEIVFDALVNHPDIIDRMKHTTQAGMASLEAFVSAAFGANVLVSAATYSNTNESASFSATAIIDDDCLVCYVNPGAGIFDATAGKTFEWPGGGGLGTIYRDPSTRRHSNVFQHKEQWDQAATATDLGYFFADVV